MNLIPISEIDTGIDILYQLLKERTPDQSISHKKMPTLAEHISFIDSDPYLAWYFVEVDEIVGTIYITRQREVGISIFKHQQGKGYGKEAVKMLRNIHPGRLLANISPLNDKSIDFFKGLGAKLIQFTYEL